MTLGLIRPERKSTIVEDVMVRGTEMSPPAPCVALGFAQHPFAASMQSFFLLRGAPMFPLQGPETLIIETVWFKIAANGSLALGTLILLTLIMLGARFLFMRR